MALVLTDSGEKLEITATVVIPFTVHYADYVGATPVFTPGVAGGDTIVGTKDLLVAPGSGQRVIRTITVHNDSGGVDTITIQLDDGGVNYTIVTVILPDDYTLCYDEDGWCVLDSSGAIGTTLFTHAILGPHHSDAATDVVSQGSLIFGNATPAWDELVHPGAVNRVLQSSAAEVVWSVNAVTFPTAGAVPVGSGANTQIAYWTAANTLAGDAGLVYNAATDTITIAGDILMADDKFIGITGDIRIEFDSSDGDIMLHLGDAAGSDEVQVLDSGGNVMTYMDSDGNTQIAGHVGIGAAGSVLATSVITMSEFPTSAMTGGMYYLRPSAPANTADVFYGMQFIVQVETAVVYTGTCTGVLGSARVADTIAATLSFLFGGWYFVDAEDATVTTAMGNRVFTPYCDTGIITTGYGVRIERGTLGAVAAGNRITTLYGLRIENMVDAKAGTSYAIYSAGGNSYHAGRVAIGSTVAAIAVLHVDQGSPTAGIPALKLDQGDVSEQCILFSSDAADRDINLFTVDVTGTPKFWWDESENALVYTCPNDGAEVSLIIQNAATGAGTIASLRFVDTTAISDYGKIAVERSALGHSTMRLYTLQTGALVETLTLNNTGRVGVRTPAPLAELHVDQPSASAAIPVLYLDQGDPSEEMIEFACTIGVGNAIEAVGGKTLTTTHFIKVTLPGALTRYIPVGTIA